ncbi:MAG TPA: hypothetical protein VN541_12595 [Tepidisphaeraceae bacterium]|nr:hypothetical protein [Tepidisphaeraceae bacterium]
MVVSLSPDTQKLIEERMKKKDFQSADELVRAALGLLDMQDRLGNIGDDELEAIYPGFREKIAQGLAEADAGKVTDGEAFFAELEREEQEFEKQQSRKTA